MRPWVGGVMSWTAVSRSQYFRKYGDTAALATACERCGAQCLASARRRPTDPGREQVAEADHAADGVVVYHREVAEAVHEHDLGRFFGGRVGTGRLRVGSHPLRDLGCRQVSPRRRGLQDVA